VADDTMELRAANLVGSELASPPSSFFHHISLSSSIGPTIDFPDRIRGREIFPAGNGPLKRWMMMPS